MLYSLKLTSFVAASALLAPSGCSRPVHVTGKPCTEPKYAYGSKEFLSFVRDSYHVAGDGSAAEFMAWFDQSFKGVSQKTVHDWLAANRALLKEKNSDPETQVLVAKELHQFIKKSIPRFSLDRGFEFFNTARLGERQCLLQSVLTASLLQACGLRAGVVMVWSNQNGVQSNNGHVVCLLHLPDDKAMLVDCSDPTPAMTHQGLFMRRKMTGTYAFMNITYDASGEIVRALSLDDHSTLDADGLACLGSDYVRSQFDFYRGERVPGGLLAQPGTPRALQESERYLKKSVQECAENSLSLYSLGRVHLKLGQVDLAKRELIESFKLYSAQGWVPDGVSQTLSSIKS